MVDSKLLIVHYDKTMLHQVLQNLISNALKHGKKKNIIVNVACVIDSNEYIFSVSDNGLGIDPIFIRKFSNL